MGYRDCSGIPNTCPLIDGVIKQLYNLDSESEDFGSDVTDIEQEMENIRSANSDLREWGNLMARQSDDFESERDYANKELESANDRIAELREELMLLLNERLEGHIQGS